jgi:hypothetical protein
MEYPSKLKIASIWLMLLYIGCQKPTLLELYNDWLNKPYNGCIVTKKISGINFTMKYQPKSYMELKDKCEGNTDHKKNDVSIQNTLTFLLSITADADSPQKNLFYAPQDRNEYIERVITQNFFMAEHIKLYKDGIQYKPRIAITENTYELNKNKIFLIVFSNEQLTRLPMEGECFLIYEDLNLGKIYFPFDLKNLSYAEHKFEQG